MRLAIGFNPVMPAKDMARIAAKAEQLGYESMWMHESLFQRDVVTYLSAMSLSTSTLKLASGAINTYTRHPVNTATTFATLSELSGGRIILGLGLGSFPTIPLIGHKIFPVSESRPLRRIREYVKVLRSVWSGEKTTVEGEFFTVKDLQMGFKLESPIPLYIASLSPMVQRFAGETADGAILSPSINTVERTGKMVANVLEGARRKSRSVENVSYMLTSVDSDPRKARDAVRGFYFFVYQLAEVVKSEDLHPYGVSDEDLAPLKEAWKRGGVAAAKDLVPDAAIDALAIAGSRSEAQSRLEQYLKAGVTLPALMPIGNIDFAIQAMAPA